MYTRQQASQIRQKFWTLFGQYMHPVPNAEGERINWINYKTGKKHIFFRMDAGKSLASIYIELRHADAGQRDYFFQQLVQVKSLLEGEWVWNGEAVTDDGMPVATISAVLSGVTLFEENDWPAIIDFLKTGLIQLDAFWIQVKDSIE